MLAFWRRSHLSLILLLLLSILLPEIGRGETPPISRESDGETFECAVNTGKNAQDLAVSPSTESQSGESLERLQVSRFEFVGATVFSQDRLQEEIAEFTEREITFTELMEAVSRITGLYNQQGYINSYAVPYPQKIEDGVVKIAVIEGGLGTIFLTREGRGRLNPNYICSRLAIAATPLNLDNLLNGLRLLQLDPLIANISAEVVPGATIEQNNLKVRFQEAKTLSLEIGGDNGRAPSVGSFRRQVQLRQANLLGLGDSFRLGYANTDGSDTFFADYTIPINARNGTLSVSYGTGSNRVIEEPFDAINLRGDSRYFDVNFRQPIWQEPEKEFALGWVFSRRESDTYILGEPFPLAEGGSSRGKTRLSVIRFYQDGLWRGDDRILAFYSQFSLGLDLLDATVRSEAPDGRFFAWRGQGQWVQRFAPDQILLLRGDVQWATRALVPLEQFSLGGWESVRGYRQDTRLTDNGMFGSVEFRYPLIGNSQERWGVLQLAPFLDFGTAWNSSDRQNLQPQTLASGGLGLRWQLGNDSSASLYWGIPLVDVESSNRTWQENGLYFTIQTRLFF